jgi:hypothetical protein
MNRTDADGTELHDPRLQAPGLSDAVIPHITMGDSNETRDQSSI